MTGDNIEILSPPDKASVESNLINQDKTLLLTTHYMAEADDLCDRVAIINQGQLLACDTPSRLKAGLQRDAIFRLETTPLNGSMLLPRRDDSWW